MVQSLLGFTPVISGRSNKISSLTVVVRSEHTCLDRLIAGEENL